MASLDVMVFGAELHVALMHVLVGAAGEIDSAVGPPDGNAVHPDGDAGDPMEGTMPTGDDTVSKALSNASSLLALIVP